TTATCARNEQNSHVCAGTGEPGYFSIRPRTDGRYLARDGQLVFPESRAASTPCDAREPWPAASVAGHLTLGRSPGHGVSKAARSHRREPAKDVREMALIGKPHGTGDFADGEIRFGQPPFRPLDPCPQAVPGRGAPDSLADLPMEVKATHPGNIRQIIEADGAAEPCVDIRHHTSQLVARQAALHRRNSLERAWELHEGADAL